MQKYQPRFRARISNGLCAALATTMIVVAPAITSLPASAQVQVIDVSDLAERLLPAVVNVSSVTLARTAGPRSPFGPNGPGGRGLPGQQREGRSLGSGFIIDGAGFIVTNNHVIDGAKEVTVTTQDGTEYDATIVGTDPLVDIALLKIDADQRSTGRSLGPFGVNEGRHTGDCHRFALRSWRNGDDGHYIGRRT